MPGGEAEARRLAPGSCARSASCDEPGATETSESSTVTAAFPQVKRYQRSLPSEWNASSSGLPPFALTSWLPSAGNQADSRITAAYGPKMSRSSSPGRAERVRVVAHREDEIRMPRLDHRRDRRLVRAPAAEVAHDREGEPGGGRRRGPEPARRRARRRSPRRCRCSACPASGRPAWRRGRRRLPASTRAPFWRLTNACCGTAVRKETMALRCVTLSATGPRVSATAATAAAITVAPPRTRACERAPWRAIHSTAGGPPAARRARAARSATRCRSRRRQTRRSGSPPSARCARLQSSCQRTTRPLRASSSRISSSGVSQTVSASGMTARSGSVRGEPSSSVKAKRPPTGSARETPSTNVSLSGNASIVSSKQHDVERAGRERRDLRDLEAAGQAVGARAGDVRPRLRSSRHRGSSQPSSRVRNRPGPGDSAAQVEHRDAGRDPRPLRERPDLPRAHEALLLDVLAGVVGLPPGLAAAPGRTDRARPVSQPRTKPMHENHGTSPRMFERGAMLRAAPGSLLRAAPGPLLRAAPARSPRSVPSCCFWPRWRKRSAWGAPAGWSEPRRR